MVSFSSLLAAMVDRLTNLRIVLVETAGARNLGSIARIMKNMGLGQLVLVNPQCDHWAPEARQMAVHAVDVLAAAQIVPTLPEALAGCHRAIATTVRSRSVDTPLEHPRLALPWLIEAEASRELRSALIFGAEDRGLSNEELKYAQRFVAIPASAAYPSLNLAQAVGICCYELAQVGWGSRGRAETGLVPSPPDMIGLSAAADLGPTHTTDAPVAAAIDVLEGYYQHLEALLLQIGYLHPHTAISRMEKFRRLYNRASLSEAEVAMLRGILRQINWALTVVEPTDRPDD
jgi:tRNA/rRNA methyltransferase